MKLLVVTQVIDQNDPVLGFFHTWVSALAPRYEQVTVICLRKGEYALPENVRVYSLGKEQGRQSRSAYVTRFLSLAWKLRTEYDAVFVHMNQEYLLIAGWLWKLLGKHAYLWRNHYAGSWQTDIAAAFCTKVFCTSAHSYTARYRKTILMPVGISLERFHPDPSVPRTPRSILFLARMAPAKHPEVLLSALTILAQKGIAFSASFYGDPLPQDRTFYDALTREVETLGLHGQIQFYAGVPNAETPELYQSHDIFVNCSQSGMFDKTLFEAAACGARVLAASADFALQAGAAFGFDGTPASLAASLESFLEAPPETKAAQQATLHALTAKHTLEALVDQLAQVMR